MVSPKATAFCAKRSVFSDEPEPFCHEPEPFCEETEPFCYDRWPTSRNGNHFFPQTNLKNSIRHTLENPDQIRYAKSHRMQPSIWPQKFEHRCLMRQH
jgi:hypothetical protein